MWPQTTGTHASPGVSQSLHCLLPHSFSFLLVPTGQKGSDHTAKIAVGAWLGAGLFWICGSTHSDRPPWGPPHPAPRSLQPAPTASSKVPGLGAPAHQGAAVSKGEVVSSDPLAPPQRRPNKRPLWSGHWRPRERHKGGRRKAAILLRPLARLSHCSPTAPGEPVCGLLAPPRKASKAVQE